MVCIPPSDSPYFSSAQHGTLASHTVNSSDVIIVGDFNGRVGQPRLVDEAGCVYQYDGVKDMVVNSHGKTLVNICQNNDLVIVNNLLYGSEHFNGNLSFKRRDTWLSEIDLCLCKVSCLDKIRELHVHQNVRGSDHAPISIALDINKGKVISAKELVERAATLGQSYQPQTPTSVYKTRKSASYQKINKDEFIRKLNIVEPPNLRHDSDIDEVLTMGYDIIMEAATSCTRETENASCGWDAAQPTWSRILESQDNKLLWRSVNWKGSLEVENKERPSDSNFKEHVEKLLNPKDTSDIGEEVLENSLPYIPVLDDPFSMQEFMESVNGINKNKSYSGVCPGIIQMLPESWLSFLLLLFNVVFMNMNYPVLWCYSKLVLIFKAGNRMLCDNYRGISIMDTLAKIYDALIYNRLLLWCNISKCQAGAQKKRSCIEQILSLRLLCDFAVFRNVKLYVLFIDFSKAYDRVPRNKMLEVLKSLGCGKRMLLAVQAMYKCTRQL